MGALVLEGFNYIRYFDSHLPETSTRSIVIAPFLLSIDSVDDIVIWLTCLIRDSINIIISVKLRLALE